MIERLRNLSRLDLLLWTSALLTCGLWVWQIAVRGLYALDLEWMESGALHQAHRIMLGSSAYPEPSSDFVPHLYTPGYSYLLALFGQILPLDFGLARGVSLLGIGASVWAIVKIILREGRPATHCMVGVALFLSSFRFCYRWMDLARADSVMVALVLWGLYFLRSGWGHARNVLLAGLLLSAAYWVKQSAFTIIVGSGVAALWVAPRLVWLYVLTIGLLGGVGTWIYNASSDGWFWYYIFELHQSHRFNVVRLRQKTWAMMLHSWPFVVVMLGAFLWRATAPWLVAQRKLDRAMERLALARQSAYSGPIFWWIMLVSTATAGAISYSTQWAEPNAFLPFCATLGALVGVLMSREGKAAKVDKGLVAAQLVFLLVIDPNYAPIQAKGIGAIFKSYPLMDPWRGQPDQAHRERAQALADQWDDLSLGEGIQDQWGVKHQGSLLALQHPWWGIRVGGAEHVASMALNDLGPKAGKPVREAMAKRIADAEFAAIWVEGRTPRWMADAMGSSYGLAKRYRGKERVLPLSGWMSKAGTVSAYTRDQRLYLATRAVPVPEGCTRVAGFEDATAQGLVVTRGNLNESPSPRRARYGVEYEGGAGQYAWVSGRRRKSLRGMGSAQLALPGLGDAGWVSLGVAWVGERSGLSVRVLGVGGEVLVELPEEAGVMRRVVVRVEGEGPWVLEVVDGNMGGVLVLDEIWSCEGRP